MRGPSASLGRSVVWVSLALLMGLWLWFTWVTDKAEWLETSDHIGSIVAGVSIIWALVSFVAFSRLAKEAEKKASRYRAWQTINSAQGMSGNGGRVDAVQDLMADGVSLAGVNLDGAYLAGLRLPPLADLSYASLKCVNNVPANLRGAHLGQVDFGHAHLEGADLSEAHLVLANLRKAHLEKTALRGADLHKAQLSEAVLDGATLREAQLGEADLYGASLRNAVCRYAFFADADLRRTNLEEADFFKAELPRANLTGA